MNRRFLLDAMALAAVAYAAVLSGTFLINAVGALEKAPLASRGATVPLAEMGIAVAAVIASLGVLIASVRYLAIPGMARATEGQRPVFERIANGLMVLAVIGAVGGFIVSQTVDDPFRSLRTVQKSGGGLTEQMLLKRGYVRVEE